MTVGAPRAWSDNIVFTAMSKPKNDVTDLLATIKRQPTSSIPEKAIVVTPAHLEPEAKKSAHQEIAAEKKSKSKLGKPVQFWMYDDYFFLRLKVTACITVCKIVA